MLVEGVLAVELKCVERFAEEHVAPCINYLRASGVLRALPPDDTNSAAQPDL
jgi:hypothetical protein